MDIKISFLILFLMTLIPQSNADIESIFKDQTNIKDPFKLRDPFESPKFKSNAQKKRIQRGQGILENVDKLAESFDLEKITVVGVLIGKNRRVVLRSGNKNFTLKEGDTYGKDGPEIKAILPGGIILVEKITNIYGENEFIETVVPISK